MTRFALEHGLTLVTWDDIQNDSSGDLGNAVKGMIVCAHAPVDNALLDKFPNLKVVSNYGGALPPVCRRRTNTDASPLQLV